MNFQHTSGTWANSLQEMRWVWLLTGEKVTLCPQRLLMMSRSARIKLAAGADADENKGEKTRRENKQTSSRPPFNSIWSTLHFSLPPRVSSDTHVQLEPNYTELHLSSHMWKSLLHIEARLLVMMSSLITDLCFCHFTGLLTFMCWSNYLLWLSCQSIECNNWCYETMPPIKPQSNSRSSGLVRQVRHKPWKREERLIGKLLKWEKWRAEF